MTNEAPELASHSFEKRPQVYTSFPTQLPQDSLALIQKESARHGKERMLNIPSLEGATAWMTIGMKDVGGPASKIILQAPLTGPNGERYHTMTAEYDPQTGKRLGPNGISASVADQTATTLES